MKNKIVTGHKSQSTSKYWDAGALGHRGTIHYYCVVIFLSWCFLLLPQAVHAASTNQISQFGITWTFDGEYEYGQFANGDYWVVGPITIMGINPPSYESNGRMINGSMVNPSPRNGRKQGYDSEIFGSYTQPGDYDSTLNVARPNGGALSASNPLVLQPGSSLVSTISMPNSGGRTALQTAVILTVLSSPAAEGSFRPPYVDVPKNIRFNKNQLNYSLLKRLLITQAIRNVMPRLEQYPGDEQSDSVERMFERPWLDHIPGWLGRHHHPLENMDDYDRDICNQEGIAALMLHLDFTNQEKETLFIRLVQLGIDNYGVIQDGGRENWLQDSGRKFPILFAGLILNEPAMRSIGEKSGDYAYTAPYGPGNPPPDLIRFEEDEMTFYVSQLDVDMTHSASWSPDYRDAEQIPYERADIGLPEWGKVRLYDRHEVNKCWDSVYRSVICPAWGGIALAIHIMEAKALWNHDAFFDYKDRFMEVEGGNREHSRFIEAAWDTYRADYGPVWTRDDPTDPYSQGHYEGDGDGGDTRYGDVFEDGEITAYDASLTARLAVGLDALTPEKLEIADVNGDGEVTAFDAALIAQYAVGIITKFPRDE